VVRIIQKLFSEKPEIRVWTGLIWLSDRTICKGNTSEWYQPVTTEQVSPYVLTNISVTEGRIPDMLDVQLTLLASSNQHKHKHKSCKLGSTQRNMTGKHKLRTLFPIEIKVT